MSIIRVKGHEVVTVVEGQEADRGRLLQVHSRADLPSLQEWHFLALLLDTSRQRPRLATTARVVLAQGIQALVVTVTILTSPKTRKKQPSQRQAWPVLLLQDWLIVREASLAQVSLVAKFVLLDQSSVLVWEVQPLPVYTNRKRTKRRRKNQNKDRLEDALRAGHAHAHDVVILT